MNRQSVRFLDATNNICVLFNRSSNTSVSQDKRLTHIREISGEREVTRYSLQYPLQHMPSTSIREQHTPNNIKKVFFPSKHSDAPTGTTKLY